MLGMDIQVSSQALAEEFRPLRHEAYDVVSKALDARFKGKAINLRAVLEGMITVQLHMIMKAANQDQDYAFKLLLGAVATFHTHCGVGFNEGDLDAKS